VRIAQLLKRLTALSNNIKNVGDSDEIRTPLFTQ